MVKCSCFGHHDFEIDDDKQDSTQPTPMITDRKDEVELQDINLVHPTTPSSSSDIAEPVYRIRRIGKGETSTRIVLQVR